MVVDEKWIAKKQALPFASANGRERCCRTHGACRSNPGPHFIGSDETVLLPGFQANLSCEVVVCSFGWRDWFFWKKGFFLIGAFSKTDGFFLSRSCIVKWCEHHGVFVRMLPVATWGGGFQLEPPQTRSTSSCLKNKGWYGLLPPRNLT